VKAELQTNEFYYGKPNKKNNQDVYLLDYNQLKGKFTFGRFAQAPTTYLDLNDLEEVLGFVNPDESNLNLESENLMTEEQKEEVVLEAESKETNNQEDQQEIKSNETPSPKKVKDPIQEAKQMYTNAPDSILQDFENIYPKAITVIDALLVINPDIVEALKGDDAADGDSFLTNVYIDEVRKEIQSVFNQDDISEKDIIIFINQITNTENQYC
jgi:hypothetical protein